MMKTALPDSRGSAVPGDRRLVRWSLVSTLLAVAAVYVWYCAPLGLTRANAAVVGCLAVAAAVSAAMSVRLLTRTSTNRRSRGELVPDH
jgi:hypothetical protein